MGIKFSGRLVVSGGFAELVPSLVSPGAYAGLVLLKDSLSFGLGGFPTPLDPDCLALS